jgi:alpha-galactosidase
MNKDLLSRRDFVRLGAGAIGFSAMEGVAQGKSELQSKPAKSAATNAARRRATDSEMQMADDLARSFGAPGSGWERRAATQLLPAAIKPPFSFRYGAEESAGLLRGWPSESKASNVEGVGVKHEVTYRDPQTKLVISIEAVQFKDFPAVEWVIHFKNEGASETAIVENIQALDLVLLAGGGEPTIHYALGATCSANDFKPMQRLLGQKGKLSLKAGGGRSSSDYLPFFNYESKREGVVVAIGWSGEWAADFRCPAGDDVQVRAGLALTHLKLLPGEEIRTPRILTLFWQGDRLRGNNMLRQFILAHHRPQADGKPLNMPLCNGNWGATPASVHIENAKQIAAHKLPVDYYWIDAEWFGDGPWWRNVGNWQPNKKLYPQGLKPLSDCLHAGGSKLLMWFEPERVCKGTPWYTERAEWLLEVPKDKRHYRGFEVKDDFPQSDPRWVPNESARNQIQENDKLFNFAIPEARRFITDYMSAKIDEFGLDCFRHDANIAPLEFWRAADAPDRQGITEIRWVEGLYAFWDELLRCHPHLIIDNCASGGRRIDLETVGRTLPLWRTDFPNGDTVKQCHTYGLLHWVPLNSTSAGNLGGDTDYNVRSTMSSGMVFDLFGNGDTAQSRKDYSDFPFERAKGILKQYRSIQKYFHGDYYPLTEYSQAEDAWMAYQLDRPEEDEGLVVALKRTASPYAKAVFALKALRKDALYEITNLDTNQKTTVPGSQLTSHGLEVLLCKEPDSALIHYQRKSA